GPGVGDVDGVLGIPGPGEALAVWAKRDAENEAAETLVAECKALLAGTRIPDFDRPVPAGRGEPCAVGAETHAGDRFGVSAKGNKLLTGGRIPDLHLAGCIGYCHSARRGNTLPIGAER